MLPKIATLINYCSIDRHFIDICISAVAPFSNKIIVSTCTNLYSGEEEDIQHIISLADNYPNVDVLLYQWKSGIFPRFFWDNVGRALGLTHMEKDNEWVLFLDADEIIETSLFLEFIKTSLYNNAYSSYKLANYWYFREPIYRAKTIEDSVVICKADDAVEAVNFFKENDREKFALGFHQRWKKINDKPMVHHYSWVRTKQQMLSKVKNWGHSNDKNWTELVEKEFERPFSGKCFVNNYDFETVQDIFNIPKEAYTQI